jgi:predicted dehydrogenase
MPTNSKEALRVAVIGGGHIAQQHLPILSDLPEAHVVALADKDPQMLANTADRFGIPERRSSHLEVLEKDQPDAVFVLVSVLKVATVAADFLQAGIPTFLEKPPGLYTTDTRRLAALARQTDTPAMVGVNRRFYSNLLVGREKLLASGPVHSITVDAHEDIDRLRAQSKFPPEVVSRWSAANGIHALDLLRFFAGDIAEITALQQTVEGPMPDSFRALITFEQGAMGCAQMDWFAPGGHQFEVRGTGVRLCSDAGFASVTLQRRGAEAEHIELDDIDRRYKPGFFRQDQTFLTCVRDNKPLPFPACDLDDAVKTMEMIDAISG